MKVRRDLLPVMAILAAGMLYYYVSLQSHIVFGDEGYYSSVGRWMADNAVMPVYEPYYHTDIYHPKFVKHPLHFFFNVGAWLLLGELGIKLLIPVFSVLTALLLYAFLKREGAPWLGAASALIFLMLPGVVTYGVLDYVETLNFMLITLALVFGYYTVNGRGLAHTLLAGVFLGLALLTDITALFAALVLLCYFVFSRRFGSWRNVLLVIVLAGIMVSPFLIRNMMLFGSPCYAFLSGGECAPKIDMEIAHSPYLGGTFVSGEAAVGTGAGLLKMGVLNYMRFAFGWSASVILLFGIAFAAAKRDKFSLLMVAWFVAFLLLNVHQALYGGRSEDLQRYSLFGFPAVALLCGLFVTESCRWSARKHKILAGILVLVFAVAFFNYGYEKITTMASVKAFAPGFFVGCDWIKANTPQDSILYTVYSHHTAYNCDRANIQTVPDMAEIQLTNNDTSYEHLKLHGFDYVFVQQFTVSQNAQYSETISTAFLNYLETSPHFKKVYDNTATYGNSGVRLYKVL